MKECMQHASAKGDVGKDHLPKEEIAERAGMDWVRCFVVDLRKTGKITRLKKGGVRNADR